jgi:hypothetical protein
VGDAEDAEVEYQFTIKFALVTPVAAGTDLPLYNSVKGHTRNDITVQLAGSDQNVLSFTLANDLGAKMHNPMNTKVAGALTWPMGYVVTKQEPTFSCVTSKAYNSGALSGDGWTAVDITIAMANGTAGENITITLQDFVPESWNMPLEAEDLVGFGHEFGLGDGTVYNRVVAA